MKMIVASLFCFFLFLGAGAVNVKSDRTTAANDVAATDAQSSATQAEERNDRQPHRKDAEVSNGLQRVWVQYSPTVKQSKVFNTLTKQIAANTDIPESNAMQLLLSPIGENTATNSIFASPSLSSFQVHYNFYEDGLSSIAMSVNSKMLKALQNDPNVVEVKKDAKRFPIHAVSSTKLLRSQRRKLVIADDEVDDEEDGNKMPEELPFGITMVQATQVWDKGYTGKGVKVCVIDSGLDITQDEFDRSWEGRGTDAGPWYVDGCGHGTHVSGTIAARENDIGVIGVAKNADVFSFRVFDDECWWSYASHLGKAAMACYNNGAKVINMSLGGGPKLKAEEETFKWLRQNGVVTVASAGNGGNSGLSYPAAYPSIVSVAALDSNKTVAYFSQRNKQVDIAAPGVDVLSSVPMDGCSLCDGSELPYEYWSGTSMAAPHVSGVAALLWEKKPTATADQIINAMITTVEDLGAPGRDNSYGHGLVQAAKALNKL